MTNKNICARTAIKMMMNMRALAYFIIKNTISSAINTLIEEDSSRVWQLTPPQILIIKTLRAPGNAYIYSKT